MNTPGQPRATSPARGLLLGVGAALAVATAWIAVVLLTNSRQPYFMVGVALATAYGLHRGMHQPGRREALFAVAITLVVLVLGVYWSERYLVVKWFTDNDDAIDIPLVPYLDWVVEVLGHAVSQSVSIAVFGVVALGAAAYFGVHGFDHRRR